MALTKLFVALPVLITVYLWPVFLFLAYMLLLAPGNTWNGIAYLLCASFAIHYPLAILARRSLRYAGPFAGTQEKLRAVLPFWINLIVLTVVVVYLGAFCHWKFVCAP